MTKTIATLLFLAVAAALVWSVVARRDDAAAETAQTELPAVPVQVGPVTRGPITLRRTFGGELEATAEFVVAPKVAGRVERIERDLGDPVTRGQVVAHLDDDELTQGVHQAEAEVQVARADSAQAESALEIAVRNLERCRALREDGVTSESQLDLALAEELAARSYVEVTRANVTRAEAALEAARIRLGYARVTADWSGDDDHRVVSERWVDEGETVSSNARLMTIVELDPIVAVLRVPERDYALLAVGQPATLTTDAHPGRAFAGHVTRIAPVFRRATRQARVELLADNPDEDLKPGMFVRVTAELERVEDATIVPFAALTARGSRAGVFVVDAEGRRALWRPVEPGVREGERVAVRGEGISGRVVTLGQDLCDDGSPIAIVDEWEEPGAGTPGAPPWGMGGGADDPNTR